MIKADNAINIHETFSPVHIKSKMHQIRNQVWRVCFSWKWKIPYLDSAFEDFAL